MTPLVSVLVVTYNQARFIEQCILSITQQICDFDFEILVCDDHSSDETYEKCQAMATESPNLHLHRQDQNMGVNYNLAFGLEQCQGEFIAFCDGDDFWTAPDKLSTMVNVLKAKSEFSLVYSDFGKVDEGSINIESHTLKEQPERFTLNDLIDQQGPAVSAMMVRSSALPTEYPPAFYRVLNPDIFLLAWSLSKGDGYYINVAMSMYRIHQEGIWSGLEQSEKRLLQMGTRILVFGSLGSTYRDQQQTCIKRMEQLLSNTKKDGHSALFRQYLGFLPLRSRLSFQARRLYAALFVRA